MTKKIMIALAIIILTMAYYCRGAKAESNAEALAEFGERSALNIMYGIIIDAREIEINLEAEKDGGIEQLSLAEGENNQTSVNGVPPDIPDAVPDGPNDGVDKEKNYLVELQDDPEVSPSNNPADDLGDSSPEKEVPNSDADNGTDLTGSTGDSGNTKGKGGLILDP
jgi:hypothetical protein